MWGYKVERKPYRPVVVEMALLLTNRTMVPGYLTREALFSGQDLISKAALYICRRSSSGDYPDSLDCTRPVPVSNTGKPACYRVSSSLRAKLHTQDLHPYIVPLKFTSDKEIRKPNGVEKETVVKSIVA